MRGVFPASNPRTYPVWNFELGANSKRKGSNFLGLRLRKKTLCYCTMFLLIMKKLICDIFKFCIFLHEIKLKFYLKIILIFRLLRKKYLLQYCYLNFEPFPCGCSSTYFFFSVKAHRRAMSKFFIDTFYASLRLPELFPCAFLRFCSQRPWKRARPPRSAAGADPAAAGWAPEKERSTSPNKYESGSKRVHSYFMHVWVAPPYSTSHHGDFLSW